MELKRILARDTRTATDKAISLYGDDVLIISNHTVNGQTELVVALEERFGIRLPVMELSDSSSIDKLAARLLELLRGEAGSGEEQLAQNVLARHGSEHSAEELAQLNAALADSNATPNRLID